jgi:hypothetical protein
MGYRYNERNIGSYTLDGEIKRRSLKRTRVSRSFSEDEMRMAHYLLNQVADNIVLDSSDRNDQFFHDNGNILIKFDRLEIESLRSLLTKFHQ